MNKKIISIILTTVMLLSISSVGFAEEAAEVTTAEATDVAVAETSDADENVSDADAVATEDAQQPVPEIAEKLDFLHIFGLMSDYSADASIKNEKLTRADFVQMAYSMYTDVEVYPNSGFSDVPDSAEYKTALDALVGMNVINGNGLNEFKPDDIITYEQAIKIGSCMIGCGYKAETTGGFYEGYLSAAMDMGITKDIKNNGEFCFNDAVTLLYNVFKSDMILTEWTGKEWELNVLKTSFMKQYHNIYKSQGYVQSTGRSGVIDKGACAEGKVVIDDIKYEDPDNVAMEYLGYKVEFYYQKNEDELIIRYAQPYNNINVVEFSSDDLVSDSTNFSLFNIVYDDNGTEKDIRLANNVTVIYNGVEYSGFTADTFKNVDGIFVAVSNDNSKIYDTLIIRDFEYYVIDSVQMAGNLIVDKFGRILEYVIDGSTENVIWKNQDGTSVNIENLVEWNVLAVEKDINNEYMTITVFNNAVEGAVEETQTENGVTTVKINGKEYDVSKKYTDVNSSKYPVNTQVGSKVYAVLNFSDNIILFDTFADSYEPAVLVKASYDMDGDKVYVKLFTTDSKIVRYPLNQKVRIDGKGYSKALKNGESGFSEIITALQQGELITYVTSDDITNHPGETQPINVPNFVYQFVRYMLNEDGEIIKIDTAAPDHTKSADELLNLLGVNTATSRGISLEYKGYEYTFGKVLAASDSVKLFFIPSPYEIDNENAYAFESGTKFFNAGTRYKFLPYGTTYDDQSSVKNMVLIDSYTKQIGSDGICMYDSSIYTINEDDEPIVKIKAFMGRTEKEYLLDNEQILLNADLKRGDLFRYATDSTGKIDSLEKFFDYEDENFYWGGNTYNKGKEVNNPSAEYRFIYVDLYDNKGLIEVSCEYDPSAPSASKYQIKNPATFKPNSLLELHRLASFSDKKGMAVYDEADGEVAAYKKGDLKPYVQYGNRCTKMVIGTHYSEAYCMFMYNFDV